MAAEHGQVAKSGKRRDVADEKKCRRAGQLAKPSGQDV